MLLLITDSASASRNFIILQSFINIIMVATLTKCYNKGFNLKLLMSMIFLTLAAKIEKSYSTITSLKSIPSHEIPISSSAVEGLAGVYTFIDNARESYCLAITRQLNAQTYCYEQGKCYVGTLSGELYFSIGSVMSGPRCRLVGREYTHVFGTIPF